MNVYTPDYYQFVKQKPTNVPLVALFTIFGQESPFVSQNERFLHRLVTCKLTINDVGTLRKHSGMLQCSPILKKASTVNSNT